MSASRPVRGGARRFWEIARRGYRRFSAYPLATFSGALTNVVIGFVRGYVFLALFRERSTVAGFDASDAITYVWLTQALIATVCLSPWNEVAARVRTGDIAVDFLRPADIQGISLAFDLGRAWYQTCFRSLPVLGVGLLAFDLELPQAIWADVTTVASVVLAIIVSFGFRFLYNLSSFWVVEYRGVMLAALILTSFFSGFFVPIHFFPGWLEGLARLLPFPAMVQVPVDIAVGRVTGSGVITQLGMQAMWAVALLAGGQMVLRKGARKLVIQGG